MKKLMNIVMFLCISTSVTNATTITFNGTFNECNALSNKRLKAQHSGTVTEIDLSRSSSITNIFNDGKLFMKNSPSSYSQLNRLYFNIYNEYNISVPLSSEHIDINKLSDMPCMSECLHNLCQSATHPKDSQCHLCCIF